MSVSAIIVTRGNVPIEWNVPLEWERVLWDNGAGVCRVWHPESSPFDCVEHDVSDLSVYGRYAAIEHASHDLIYVQDDDVIVSDPAELVREWRAEHHRVGVCSEGPDGCEYDGTDPCFQCGARRQWLVANMPQEFRHDGYTDSCLVGFGACFHRDLPKKSFGRFMAHHDHMIPLGIRQDVFWRTCDVVFTTLTPRVLVDVPKVNREFASDPDRMWKQPSHYGERVRMLELARKVRDA